MERTLSLLLCLFVCYLFMDKYLFEGHLAALFRAGWRDYLAAVKKRFRSVFPAIEIKIRPPVRDTLSPEPEPPPLNAFIDTKSYAVRPDVTPQDNPHQVSEEKTNLADEKPSGYSYEWNAPRSPVPEPEQEAARVRGSEAPGKLYMERYRGFLQGRAKPPMPQEPAPQKDEPQEDDFHLIEEMLEQIRADNEEMDGMTGEEMQRVDDFDLSQYQ